jgi:hypothetical protein
MSFFENNFLYLRNSWYTDCNTPLLLPKLKTSLNCFLWVNKKKPLLSNVCVPYVMHDCMCLLVCMPMISCESVDLLKHCFLFNTWFLPRKCAMILCSIF